MKRFYKLRKPLLVVLVFAALFSMVFLTKFCEDNNFYASADFEPIETIFLVWNEDDSSVIAEIAAQISPYESVTIFCDDLDEEEVKIKSLITSKGGQPKNINLMRMANKPNNSWIRDYSPVYLKRNNELKILNPRYWDSSVNISEFLAQRDQLPIEKSNFYSLGGTREFNGRGTGIFVFSHEKSANEELDGNRKKIEKALKKQYHLKKVIWLNKGIPQDELPSYGPIDNNIFPTGSNHHIDEFCRFISPTKIMISYITESEIGNSQILAEAQKRLNENYWILRNATDQDGNLFEVIPMPYAPIIIRPFNSTTDTSDFRTEVTSYMNFLITNHTILLPSYQHIDLSVATKQKEEFIAQTFQKHFPDKKVIFISVGDLNARGGGIHCLTASKPLIKKKTPKSFKLKFRKKRKV